MLIGFLSFLWSVTAASVVSNGTKFSNFLSIVVWIFLLWLIIKKHPIISDIIGAIIVVVIEMRKGAMPSGAGFSFSMTPKTWEGIEAVLAPILLYGILALLAYSAFKQWEKGREEVDRRKKNAKERGVAYCPKCGSTSFDYFPLGIPYDDNGKVRHMSAKYHCRNCEARW